MLCNNVSGPEIGLPGRISAGFQSGKLQNRLSGRPSAGRRADWEACPTRIQPKSGPHGLARTLAGQGPTGSPLANLPAKVHPQTPKKDKPQVTTLSSKSVCLGRGSAILGGGGIGERERDLVGIVWGRFGAGLGPYMGKPSLTVPVFASSSVSPSSSKTYAFANPKTSDFFFVFEGPLMHVSGTRPPPTPSSRRCRCSEPAHEGLPRDERPQAQI